MRPFESFPKTARRLAATTARNSGTVHRAPAQTYSPAQLPTGHNPPPAFNIVSGQRDGGLAAELREVRVHRDEAVAEREQLSARLLRLMAPDQYLELAAKAGYDLSKDPLVQVKREDVVVEDQLGHWQEILNKTERARRLDPDQTLVEQARVAAMAFRWKYVDHPHNWQKDRRPKWIIVGFLLDEETEQYLLKISYRRIERMKKTTQELMEESA